MNNQITDILCAYSVNLFGLLLDDLRNLLTPTQFTVLTYKEKGYKNIEIARKLGVCPATITKRIKEIRAILREY